MTEDCSDQPPVNRDVSMLFYNKIHELFQIVLAEVQVLLVVVLQERDKNRSLSHLYLPNLDQMYNIRQILLNTVLRLLALVNINIQEHKAALKHSITRVIGSGYL